MRSNHNDYEEYLAATQRKIDNAAQKKTGTSQSSNPTKKRRKTHLPKGKIKLLSVTLCIYLLLFSSMWYILPLDKVNDLNVIGAHLSNPEIIMASSKITAWDSAKTVLNNRQEIEKQIAEENPLVESVKFERPHWTSFEIHVFEHEVVAKVTYNQQLVPLLSNGEMLTMKFFETHWGVEELGNVPELIGFYQQGKLTEMATLLKKIDGNILRQMETIQFSQERTKPNSISIRMKDGNMVKAVLNTFESKIRYYPKMLQQIGQKRGTINLEVGAYFTPY